MTEQQRQAAWEAVHRPETTGEELTRIGSAYPEFVSAIAAHPNAMSQAPAAQAPGAQVPAAQPYAAQSYPAQSYATNPHSAHTTNATPAGALGTTAAQSGRLNVFGIIALSIHVVHSLTNGFVPMLISRMAMDLDLNSMNISMFYTVTALAWALLAGGFAIAGTLQKQAPRMRWTAISSLVVSGLALLSIASTFVSSLFAPLFY